MNAKATSVVSTKGGVGKSTTAANLGAFCADAGLKTLLIDLDPVQPSLSSYYELPEVAQGGIYDLLAANITDPARIISRTIIPNLDVVISNDQNNQLNNLLLQAPDGRLWVGTRQGSAMFRDQQSPADGLARDLEQGGGLALAVLDLALEVHRLRLHHSPRCLSHQHGPCCYSGLVSSARECVEGGHIDLTVRRRAGNATVTASTPKHVQLTSLQRRHR